MMMKSVVCLAVLSVLAVCVSAGGYGGGSHHGVYGQQYYIRQPQVQYYYQPGRYYAVRTGGAGYGAAAGGGSGDSGSGALGNLSGGVAGSVIPIVILLVLISIIAPILIAALTSANQGANTLLRSSAPGK